MKKAKELLENEKYTVAEVAYHVGFNSPTYFNTCFHEYFGYSPGEYKKHSSEERTNQVNELNVPKLAFIKNNIKILKELRHDLLRDCNIDILKLSSRIEYEDEDGKRKRWGRR